eukprot:SAG31_NODE_462_length_15340_cov_2.972968_6_plen_97_part_00
MAGDVCFFVDRATYKFQHLVQGRIDMIMYYEHMVNPVLDRAARQLVFHINKQLRHFLDDYSVRTMLQSLRAIRAATVAPLSSDYCGRRRLEIPTII